MSGALGPGARVRVLVLSVAGVVMVMLVLDMLVLVGALSDWAVGRGLIVLGLVLVSGGVLLIAPGRTSSSPPPSRDDVTEGNRDG